MSLRKNNLEKINQKCNFFFSFFGSNFFGLMEMKNLRFFGWIFLVFLA
jgi:hypothetical protein